MDRLLKILGFSITVLTYLGFVLCVLLVIIGGSFLVRGFPLD
jgi:hypothetical protein